jgi:hypothetical protein
MSGTAPKAGLARLAGALREWYDADHLVAAYVAAQNVIERPRIDWIDLSRLPAADIESAATLYVPPSPRSRTTTVPIETTGRADLCERCVANLVVAASTGNGGT